MFLKPDNSDRPADTTTEEKKEEPKKEAAKP